MALVDEDARVNPPLGGMGGDWDGSVVRLLRTMSFANFWVCGAVGTEEQDGQKEDRD